MNTLLFSLSSVLAFIATFAAAADPSMMGGMGGGGMGMGMGGGGMGGGGEQPMNMMEYGNQGGMGGGMGGMGGGMGM